MAGMIMRQPGIGARPLKATDDPGWVKFLIIVTSVLFFGLFMLLPLIIVFQEALRNGFQGYFSSFNNEETRNAVRLTLFTAAIAVPCNTIFGLAAAWCVCRFQFKGRSLLLSMIELPIWVSPVIGGLIYVLLFGRQGLIGPWLQTHDIHIIFAVPGIVLATIFVTFPFVARSIIPQLETQGLAEEEAAMTLGADGWTVFFRITLPKIKWSLLYGIILCNARSMGEFGAVSVVSGHIRNYTDTLPLQIEILYNDYQSVAAFAVASLLSLLALLTLLLKTYSEWQGEEHLKRSLELYKIEEQRIV